MSEYSHSPKLDLVAEVTDHVGASVAPTAALIVRRLKQDPAVPDGVIWHATAQELERRGVEVDPMTGRYEHTDPSLVASLLGASDHYATPSEVTVC